MNETLPNEREQMLRCLDYGLNHERKIGTLATIYTFDKEHNAPLSYYITQLLNKRQGPEPAWPTRPGTITKYLKECFVPGELVTTEDHLTRTNNKTRSYYPHTEYKDLIGALVAVGIEWSLDNPHFSVQQLLGITASSGQTRAPSARYRLYKQLLEPRVSLRPKLSKVFGEFGYNSCLSMDQQFELLDEIGIITIEEGSSRVLLAEQVAEPIRQFCASVDAVVDGSEKGSYNKKLKKLACDEAVFAGLIAKGKEFSHVHAAYVDSDNIMGYIAETLPQLVEASEVGKATVQELHTDILTNYGRNIGMNGLRRILARMREQKLLEVDLTIDGIRHYYVKKSQSNDFDARAKDALAQRIESRCAAKPVGGKYGGVTKGKH